MKMPDKVGTTLNGFSILDYKKENGKTYFYAQCPICGEKKWQRTDHIATATVKSCGCLREKTEFQEIDLTGREYGQLKVIKSTEKFRTTKDGRQYRIYLCHCKNCGKDKEMSSDSLTKSVSCGCMGKEKAKSRVPELLKTFEDECLFEGTNIKNITRKKPISSNASGVTGVSFDTKRQLWIAQMIFRGERVLNSRFANFDDAVAARKAAEKKYHSPVIERYQKDKGRPQR